MMFDTSTKRSFGAKVAMRSRWLAGLFALIALTAVLIAPHAAQAQAPARPLRIVIPFATGSYTDNFARIVVPPFAERLRAVVLIDNKPGANGAIAAEAVAKSAPDGLTVLLGGSSSIAINPSLYKTLPYDPIRDLVPVARSGSLPFMLVAHPSVPATNVPELIAYAKQNPGKLTYATPNSSSLMAMEMFKRRAGVDILSVPYKSSPQAMLDMLANQVQIQIADYATAIPHVRSGKARVLAVTMAQPTPLLPGVHTVDEVLKGFDVSAWNGLFVSRNTPAATIQRIATAWNETLAQRDVQDRLATMGFDVSTMGPEAFAPYVREQIANWARLAQETGIKPE